MGYEIDDIIRLMKEEEFGIHISLLDSGEIHNGKAKLNIVVESDLDANTIQEIMWGLLEQYEEVFSDE